MRYLAALNGITNPEDEIEELLSLVSLSDAAGKKMKQFSGGMVQRVGIAQALDGDTEGAPPGLEEVFLYRYADEIQRGIHGENLIACAARGSVSEKPSPGDGRRRERVF
ncbi:MAG: hypothetical protein LBS85_00295 [Clostridiales Family XIII bacterium]|jgi:hypothetical protein|nr:hypothetical protein [Clostridiales Family XIII bacterium]